MTAAVLALALLAAPPAADPVALAEEVRRAETAFAKTMADRDHAAFASFLADDTIFLGRTALRGKKAVADAWKRFYEGKAAPFSWRPERVEVNDSGTMGLSTGPVFDEKGRQTGTYSSIWRRQADGGWKIVFDNGCNCVPDDAPVAPISPIPPRQ